MPFLLAKNGKYAFSGTSFFFASKPTPSVVPTSGGTATGVTVTTVSSETQEQYKEEILEAGTYTEAELKHASIVNVSATTAGTVNLDATQFGEPFNKVILLQRNSDGTWTELFNGYIPQSGIITITVSASMNGSMALTALRKLFKNTEYTQSGGSVTVSNSEFTQTGEVVIIS